MKVRILLLSLVVALTTLLIPTEILGQLNISGYLWDFAFFGSNSATLRNGSSSEALYVCNTCASGSAYEVGSFRFSGNIFKIQTEQSGMSSRAIEIIPANSSGWDFAPTSANFVPLGASQVGTVANPVTAVVTSTYVTAANCADAAGAAACGSAAAGAFVIDAGATSVVVSTTVVTANSEIHVTEDSSLNTRLGITCNTQSILVVGSPVVTARTAATSFTVSVVVAPTATPTCYNYSIVN